MNKHLSEREKVMLKSSEIQHYLGKMTEITRKYFPENNRDAEIWYPKNFEGFKIFIPQVDGLIDALLKACFWQQSSPDGTFSFSAPYKLDHIEFHSLCDEDNSLDSYYSYCGDLLYSGWVTDEKLATEKVIPLSVEIFDLFQNVIISLEPTSN
jgi:hypothetical protein